MTNREALMIKSKHIATAILAATAIQGCGQALLGNIINAEVDLYKMSNQSESL